MIYSSFFHEQCFEHVYRWRDIMAKGTENFVECSKRGQLRAISRHLLLPNIWPSANHHIEQCLSSSIIDVHCQNHAFFVSKHLSLGNPIVQMCTSVHLFTKLSQSDMCNKSPRWFLVIVIDDNLRNLFYPICWPGPVFH